MIAYIHDAVRTDGIAAHFTRPAPCSEEAELLVRAGALMLQARYLEMQGNLGKEFNAFSLEFKGRVKDLEAQRASQARNSMPFH